MDTQRMRIHLGAALNTLEIRRAIGVLESWSYAEESIASLNETSLQLIAEWLARETERPGAYGVMMRARQEFVRFCLDERRRTNRKLLHGITGGDGFDP